MDPEQQQLELAVTERFATLARNPAAETLFPVGRMSAMTLGYPAAELASLPAWAAEAFAGVGSPFAPGRPRRGAIVVDIGCGAGTDSLLAARWVATVTDAGTQGHGDVGIPRGHVVGVDMVPEMVERAMLAADSMGIRNVDFRIGRADSLPMPGSVADLAITNGVLNLCVDKPAVVSEIRRVLRPGGRLQMSDILLEPHVTPEEVAGKCAWSD